MEIKLPPPSAFECPVISHAHINAIYRYIVIVSWCKNEAVICATKLPILDQQALWVGATMVVI
jgi:hypothetical protein